MAKIATESRERFAGRTASYRELIKKYAQREKEILALINRDNSGTAYKKLLLAEDAIYVATLYMSINDVSVVFMETRNNDALNDARKALYKAIIYLEEIVSTYIDVPYSDYEEKLSEISNTPLGKRYYLVRKLGLAIDMLIEGFGENTKWRWTFVDILGRFATVTKNMLDLQTATKVYFDPSSPDYDVTVYYVRLICNLLDESSSKYRDKYELSTKRIDDMRKAIQFVGALRRIKLLIDQREEAEELKKKADVWREKLDSDQKAGISN
ncbi:MAG: hypothetical protein K6F69_06265 [Treponema sp.]|nr:hypothetical protein [Treponema sp.]